MRPPHADPDATHADPGSSHADLRTVARPLAGLVVLLISFVWLFTAAYHDPKPNGLEVAIVGPPELAQQLETSLDRRDAGELELRTYRSADEAREAVRDGDVSGALIVTGSQARVAVAAAGGAMTAQGLEQLLSGAARAGGLPVTTEDLRPLPEHDSRGLAGVFLVFGLVITSFAAGGLLWATGGRLGAGRLSLAIVAFALIGGLSAAFTVDVIVGALDGAFWAVAAIAALAMTAVVASVAGLGRLLGPPGMVLALFTFVLVAQSSSGGPVGHLMLPDLFKAVSPLIPTGATISAIRDAVYFSGAQSAGPLAVLAAWATLGFGMLAVGRHRGLGAMTLGGPAGAGGSSSREVLA